MKRVQIHLEEELDIAAAVEAARRGISKAALIREGLAKELAVARTAEKDPWDAMIGWLESVDPVEDLDEVIYGADDHEVR